MRTRSGYVRGLADVRTLSGLSARQIAPHTAYMKITSLELEKLRLSRVRENARRRIVEIDARCAEIRAEETRLLSRIGRQPPPAALGERQSEVPRGMRASGGLSLRY